MLTLGAAQGDVERGTNSVQDMQNIQDDYSSEDGINELLAYDTNWVRKSPRKCSPRLTCCTATTFMTALTLFFVVSQTIMLTAGAIISARYVGKANTVVSDIQTRVYDVAGGLVSAEYKIEEAVDEIKSTITSMQAVVISASRYIYSIDEGVGYIKTRLREISLELRDIEARLPRDNSSLVYC